MNRAPHAWWPQVARLPVLPVPSAKAPAAAVTAAAQPPVLQLTLLRTPKGLPGTIRAPLRALGFAPGPPGARVRRFRTLWRAPSPEVVGNILRCKELLRVQLVAGVPEVQRQPAPGWTRVGSALGAC